MERQHLSRGLVLAVIVVGALLAPQAAAAKLNVIHGPAVPPNPQSLPPNSLVIGGPSTHGASAPIPPAPPNAGPTKASPNHPAYLRRPGLRPKPAPPAASNSQLYYHGGYTMTYDYNYAIFWEPPKLQNGGTSGVATSYNNYIYRYFTDIGGSGLFNINTQYYYDSNPYRYYIQNYSKWVNYVVDTSPYPPGQCYTSTTGYNCLTDAQIQAEVRKVLNVTGWTPSLYKQFFVYTGYGEGSCFNNSNSSCYPNNFCAYHYWGLKGSSYFIYANMPYVGTTTGCRARASYPSGTLLAPNGNSAIDSVLNITSHEQMEGVTDPYGNGWYGLNGIQDENGDKCAYIWGSRPYLNGYANQYINSHYYILQTEWNNYRGGCTRGGP